MTDTTHEAPDDLMERARELLVGVTDGPWQTDEGGEVGHYGHTLFQWPVYSDQSNPDRIHADMRFVAEARELVPAMADRIEELEAKLASAEDIIHIVASDTWSERIGEAVDLSCEYLAAVAEPHKLKGQDDEVLRTRP
jgi:hypothetical protein